MCIRQAPNDVSVYIVCRLIKQHRCNEHKDQVDVRRYPDNLLFLVNSNPESRQMMIRDDIQYASFYDFGLFDGRHHLVIDHQRGLMFPIPFFLPFILTPFFDLMDYRYIPWRDGRQLILVSAPLPLKWENLCRFLFVETTYCTSSSPLGLRFWSLWTTWYRCATGFCHRTHQVFNSIRLLIVESLPPE